MEITWDVNRVGVTLLDAGDWSWTWDEEVGKFRHERLNEFKTFQEVLDAYGPVTLCIDDVKSEDIKS